MVCVFKIDAAIRNTFPKCICGTTPKIGRLLPKIGKFSPKNRKASSEEPLGSYTHKLPKRGAASLPYLPRLRLDLPRSRLGLPCLCLFQNSGPATEDFSNRGINFKDTYCIFSNAAWLPPLSGATNVT